MGGNVEKKEINPLCLREIASQDQMSLCMNVCMCLWNSIFIWQGANELRSSAANMSEFYNMLYVLLNTITYFVSLYIHSICVSIKILFSCYGSQYQLEFCHLLWGGEGKFLFVTGKCFSAWGETLYTTRYFCEGRSVPQITHRQRKLKNSLCRVMVFSTAVDLDVISALVSCY